MLHELVEKHNLPVVFATSESENDGINACVVTSMEPVWTPSEFAIAAQILTAGVPEYPSQLIDMIAKISIERDIRMGREISEDEAEILGIVSDDADVN